MGKENIRWEKSERISYNRRFYGPAFRTGKRRGLKQESQRQNTRKETLKWKRKILRKDRKQFYFL